MATVPNNIGDLRRQRDLTGTELADLVGVSRQTLSDWENEHGQPTLANALALARALDVALEDLGLFELI